MQSEIKSYRDLIVWQKSMDLVVASYELAKKVLHHEIYGLIAQIQRAAVSTAFLCAIERYPITAHSDR